VPFSSVPAKDFFNRESELAYLKRLCDKRQDVLPGNILLEGCRGSGKTELIKQLFRFLFWEEKKIVPFYYSFRRATLKSSSFARDYLSRFVRQYLAYVKRDPAFIDHLSTPLPRLFPVMQSHRLNWMIELIEDFEDHSGDDLYGRILAALSAPVAAAGRGGMPVVVMLDDFPLSQALYESSPGDMPGLVGFFEESLKSSLCFHILTGSPEGALEAVFVDNSLRGRAERMALKLLPEDAACSLFRSLCEKLEIDERPGASLKFLRTLGGNPLYIRNVAKAMWKMRKKEAGERDLWEAYAYEVTEGETFFYWSLVLAEAVKDVTQRRTTVKLLMHLLRSDVEVHRADRAARILGMSEAAVRPILDSLYRAGLVRTEGREDADAVFQDFVRGLYIREVEGTRIERTRELIAQEHYSREEEPFSFEMTIPMASDAELVAARAAEQIARNVNLDPEIIDHIQLAIIESCINAMEHSGSYEKKVYLRFTISGERLEIAIESPGRYFDPEEAEGLKRDNKPEPDQKRGWGLKLMRKIMDDVRVERIGDRTRLLLIKKIKGEEVRNERGEL
jgi:anti-sigma regulatory factor (Ser/Thr protein kinase)